MLLQNIPTEHYQIIRMKLAQNILMPQKFQALAYQETVHQQFSDLITEMIQRALQARTDMRFVLTVQL